MGNSNTPASWATAPSPTSITQRTLANGNVRVTLIWANNAIQKQWLQVRLKAGDNSDLSADDVFYFGNAMGESGNTPANAFVNSTDMLGAWSNPRMPSNRATITNVYDYNRDSLVNSQDMLLPWANPTTPSTALKLITVPAGNGLAILTQEVSAAAASVAGGSTAAVVATLLSPISVTAIPPQGAFSSQPLAGADGASELLGVIPNRSLLG